MSRLQPEGGGDSMPLDECAREDGHDDAGDGARGVEECESLVDSPVSWNNQHGILAHAVRLRFCDAVSVLEYLRENFLCDEHGSVRHFERRGFSSVGVWDDFVGQAVLFECLREESRVVLDSDGCHDAVKDTFRETRDGR